MNLKEAVIAKTRAKQAFEEAKARLEQIDAEILDHFQPGRYAALGKTLVIETRGRQTKVRVE